MNNPTLTTNKLQAIINLTPFKHNADGSMVLSMDNKQLGFVLEMHISEDGSISVETRNITNLVDQEGNDIAKCYGIYEWLIDAILSHPDYPSR